LPETAAELGALLAAGLEDDVVVARRLHHGARFGDRQGQRLLAIDVLARPRRQNRGNRVPVIGRGDDDGIYVAAGQQFAEIDILSAATIRAGLALLSVGAMDTFDGILAADAMNIANGDDLHAAIAKKPAQVAPPHHADADEAEIDAVVRPLTLALLSANV
jgi:hypothetical protein